MIAIQLPINFHVSRTVPVSDLCKNAGKTQIEKIYVWNTDCHENVHADCMIQRGVLEPWMCTEMEVSRKKTKVPACYPVLNDSGWTALTLTLKEPKSPSDPPHCMIIEIWCN